MILRAQIFSWGPDFLAGALPSGQGPVKCLSVPLPADSRNAASPWSCDLPLTAPAVRLHLRRLVRSPWFLRRTCAVEGAAFPGLRFYGAAARMAGSRCDDWLNDPRRPAPRPVNRHRASYISRAPALARCPKPPRSAAILPLT